MSKKCFHGGASINALGVDFSNIGNRKEVVRADVTDAWYNPAPKIMKVISDNLDWSVRNSPPTFPEGFVKTISEVRGIPEENLIVGSGSSDLMYLFFPLFAKGKEAIISDPMYGEYSHIIENVVDGKIKRVKQTKEDGFKVNIEKLIENVDESTGLIILVNPNNPTGNFLMKKDIVYILENIPESVLLFVDETYVEYIGKEQSVETLVTTYRNLIVLKSMSKIYALSGVRAGYLAAPSGMVEKMSKLNPPWGMSLQAQIAGILSLKNEEYYIKKINETKQMRRKMAQEIRQIKGLKPYEAEGNFLLIEITDGEKDAEKVRLSLAEKRIYIRNPNSQSLHLNNRFIRTAVRKKEDNQKIINALKEIMS